MQISQDQLKLIRLQRITLFLTAATLFLQFQLGPSTSRGLSPFNQIFLLTELQSKILLKSTISETSEINSVAISPDGQTIISRSKDNTIKVRDLKTGKLISTIAGNADEPGTVLTSPDGQTVVSSRKNGIQIWDLKTGSLKTTVAGIHDNPRPVLISPDGQKVASSSKDGIQIWDLKTGLLKTTLHYKGKSALNTFAFSPDGQSLVSSSNDLVPDPNQTEPNAISDGKQISNIEIWNLSTGKLKRTFPSEDGYVNLVATSPDGQTVVSNTHSGGQDMTTRKLMRNNAIKIWDVKTGKVKSTFSETTYFEKYDENSIDQLTISPDGQNFVTLSGRKTVKLWDMNTGKLKANLPNPKNEDITSVVFSPDGQTLLTENDVKSWNLKTGELKTRPVSNLSIYAAISPDRQTFVDHSLGTLLIGDLKTGKYKTALVNPDGAYSSYIRSVAISPDGQTIVSSYWNDKKQQSSIQIWQMP